MSLAVSTGTLRFALGNVAAPGAQPGAPSGAPLVFAVQWLLVCLLAALVYWAITLIVFRRRAKRQPANRAMLFVALFLVVFAGSNLAIADTFATHSPLFFLPIAGFFLLFFYLFSDSRYAPTWTRWLVFVYGLTQIGSLSPSKQPSPQESQFIAHIVPLLDVLALIGDIFLVMFIVVGIAPQVYYRYRHLCETGKVFRIQRGTWIALAATLVAGSYLALAASALFTQSSSPAPSLAFLAARTGYFLLTTLIPVAMGFMLLRGQFFDRDALTNRMLVYGVLVACLILVYIAAIGLQFFIPGLVVYPLVFVFVVLVAPFMAALYRPLQAQIQARVDRRFFRRKYDAQRVLLALSKALHDEIHLDQLSKQLVAGLRNAFHPDVVTLWLRSSPGLLAQHGGGPAAGLRAAPVAARQPRPGHPSDDMLRMRRQAGTAPAAAASLVSTIALDEPTCGSLLHTPAGIDISRLPPDSSIAGVLLESGASLALPLTSDGELVGLVALGQPPDATPYTVDERELLAALVASVGPAVAVAQWEHEQGVQARERERVELELQTARRIQEALLPKAVPTLDGWQLATLYQPAREVGGDFYDFISLPDGRIGIVLGDVTDKGMPAALVMATTRSMLRAVATQQSVSPGQVLAHVNELLCPDLPSSMFVTCFYALLDPATGHLRYANAGQDLPYLRHPDGGVCELRATGMPLGLMPGMSYEEQDATLAPGDSILFYSDGLVEAHNPEHEMFGFPRLMALLGGHADGTPPIVFLLGELTSFTGTEWEQEDDITLVALLRLPRAQDGASHMNDDASTVAQLSVAQRPASSSPATA